MNHVRYLVITSHSIVMILNQLRICWRIWIRHPLYFWSFGRLLFQPRLPWPGFV